MQYFSREVTHGYFLDENDSRYTERRQRVYTFLRQPVEIEKMMTYGFFLCLDVFLYMFTLLPIRLGLAFVKMICGIFRCSGWRRTGLLDPAQKCDILKAVIFIVTVYLMSYIDTSFIYHLVRAQTLIKLYIIYNMLEVADRLFSSFGQDILDALFWTATESTQDNFIKIFLHTVLAIIYVFFHTVLVLFEATTINCAFNSHNKVLLTVMMANNFVEIKGTVFKKYDKNNLFQISCSDVRERFHYCALLFIVLLRNMQQYSWSYDHLTEIIPHMVTVLFSEYLVDWFKHAFVLKFNHIPIESYLEYRTTLAYDLVNGRQKGSISDHYDVISRRMGFIPLPLSVLLFHITRISVNFHGVGGIIAIMLGFVILNLVKIMNNIMLLGKATKYIDDDIAFAAKAETEVSVVDPFEQRGSKTILVQRPKKSMLSASTKANKAEEQSVPLETVGSVRSIKKHGRSVWFSDARSSSDDEYTLRRRPRHLGNETSQEARSATPDFDPSLSTMVESSSEALDASSHCVTTAITTPAKERSMRPPSIDMTMISSAASLTNLATLDGEDSRIQSSDFAGSDPNSEPKDENHSFTLGEQNIADTKLT